MAEEQDTLPTLEGNIFDSSATFETPQKIPSSTITDTDISKPDSLSPLISLTTPSDPILSLTVEDSEASKVDTVSSLLPDILKNQNKDEKVGETQQEKGGFEEDIDQYISSPVLDTVAPMESQEKEAAENILAIAAEGLVDEGPSTMSESQGEGTPLLGEKGTMVLFEPPAPEEAIGNPADEPNPIPEETGQELSSQDDVVLSARFKIRKPVVTHEPPSKRPTIRLQQKEAFKSALKKSRRSSKKKKKRLMKEGKIVCDKNIPVVEVDEDAQEEPSSLKVVEKPSKKSVKGSVKSKQVGEEESVSNDDILVKSSDKGKSIGRSGKRKLEAVGESSSVKKVKSVSVLGQERLRHQKVLWGRTFDPEISKIEGMKQILEMVKFQQWGHLFKEDVAKVYEDEVKSFYADLFTIEDDHIYVLVNGVDMVLDATVLGDILKVPSEGLSSVRGACGSNFRRVIVKEKAIQHGERVHEKALLPVYQLLFELVNKVLLPRAERRSITSRSDLYLMEALDEFCSINLPAIMIEHIQKVAAFKYGNHGLPYGFLLTRVFKFFDVPLGNPKMGTRKQTFLKTTLDECECIEKVGGMGSTSTISQLINAQNSATKEIRKLKARNVII
ncbi:uncharacterized protein [Nicotiana tomentosiformis]|uniref:uncharacterized protein n=1 Tax=Nicotiana tomentosiformis TaxID=4098 RepID=UPI00388C6EDD